MLGDIERVAWIDLARGEAGLPPEGEKKTPPTIAELLDRLEADFKRGKRRGKWSPRTASNFKIARAAFPASMKAESLTRDDVDKYIDKKQKQHRAPATINRAIGLIASAFKLSDVRGPKFSHLSEEGKRERDFLKRRSLRGSSNICPPTCEISAASPTRRDGAKTKSLRSPGLTFKATREVACRARQKWRGSLGRPDRRARRD